MQWLIAPGITLFLILAYTLIKRYSAKRLRSYLDSLWGNERALRHADDEQIDDIAQFDMALRSHAPPLRETDSTTWNDLDMDLVFRSIDCSRSIVGSEVLYAMLHEQPRQPRNLFKAEQVAMRQVTVMLVEHFLGHAVAAAEVAAIRDADAQVAQRPAQAVVQLTGGGCRLCCAGHRGPQRRAALIHEGNDTFSHGQFVPHGASRGLAGAAPIDTGQWIADLVHG